jgi:GNAT superfamily N-acetyltransferase
MADDDVPERLRDHLRSWLGEWPNHLNGLHVVGWPGRLEPGWDANLHPVAGLLAPGGGGVLSVPPEHADAVADIVAESSDVDSALRRVPGAVGMARTRVYRATYRWSTSPAPLDDAGEWEPADAPRLPDWLRPFGGKVLVARDPGTGEYLAGVGVKRHDAFGHELAVGTEPAARGKGIARRLVAQAARRVLADGAVPLYQHDPANFASAKVADAAGFPDLGWRSVGTPGVPPRG